MNYMWKLDELTLALYDDILELLTGSAPSDTKLS
jgi:hypothetical protein